MNPAVVELHGDGPSGLAEMVAALVEQNLTRDPSRLAYLHPSVVVLDATDAAVTVTVLIDERGVRVSDGAAGDAHVRIAADAGRLLALTTAPLRAGFPDPMRPLGRAALADIATRRVRVRGLLRHPLRLARFTSLLSVAVPGTPRSGAGGRGR